MKYFLSFIFFSLLLVFNCHATDFVGVRGGNFVTRTGTPYYYVGANMWYAPLLVDSHLKGGRKRLKQELTRLEEMGVNVLRVEVEADALTANDTLAPRMHYLLRELSRRDMHCVISLQHISPSTSLTTLAAFKDEAAVIAWEIAVPMNANRDSIATMVADAARFLKTVLPQHLLAVSLENATGGNVDVKIYERFLQLPTVDFVSISLCPLKWKWSSRSALYTTLPNVYLKATDYINRLERLAMRYDKPVVIGTFAYPRELNHTEAGTFTVSRDAFFNFVFNRLAESHKKRGSLAGVIFEGWSGEGRPEKGYVADRVGEVSGRFSVYDTDSTTIELIGRYAAKVNQMFPKK